MAISRRERDEIGLIILAARKSVGWTQEQLAKAVIVDRTHVCKWENSVSTPDSPTLLKILRLTNYNPLLFKGMVS